MLLIYLHFTTWSLVVDQVHEVLAELCITKIVSNKPDKFRMFGESVIHVCSIPILKMLVIGFTTVATQVSPSEIRIVWLMPLSVLEACRTQRTKPKIEKILLQAYKAWNMLLIDVPKLYQLIQKNDYPKQWLPLTSESIHRRKKYPCLYSALFISQSIFACSFSW